MAGQLRVIEGGVPDSVTRLHRFQGDHPEVLFASPVMGRRGQYTALIPPQTIPGEDREVMLKSADLRGLMDQLDDVFSPGPATPG
jgi:hypothetical protein